MSDVEACSYTFRIAERMANETRRCRSADQSRSGRAVILVQIISWCAVGALLILRGVTTLTTEDPFSSTGSRISAAVFVTSRNPNDTESDRETNEPEGNFILFF
jgi:hypothetical protein